ncbi:hypothetical protein [Streptomyces sp. NPDC001774]
MQLIATWDEMLPQLQPMGRLCRGGRQAGEVEDGVAVLVSLVVGQDGVLGEVVPLLPGGPVSRVRNVVGVDVGGGDLADPLDIDTVYVHKDQIAEATGVKDSTLDNALSRLTKAGKIHRKTENGKDARGWYGYGPTPASDAQPE